MVDVVKHDGVSRGGWIFDDYFFISSDEFRAADVPEYLRMLNSFYRIPEKQGIKKYIANASDAYVIEHHWPRVSIQ